MNTKASIFGLIRTLLSSIGAFFLGKSLLGQHIDNPLMEGIIGCIMGVISIAWSIFDKTATIEMVQGAVRQIITFVGGFLAASGYVTNQGVESILGLTTALAPLFQGYLSRVKSNLLHDGVITTQQLKK